MEKVTQHVTLSAEIKTMHGPVTIVVSSEGVSLVGQSGAGAQHLIFDPVAWTGLCAVVSTLSNRRRDMLAVPHG